ncbi:GNAT family N-acetyltransferase [Maritimibacter sp. DP1N21-5]|uniref:GNAT family N-acetyltransferase n=1 Tax=Maritimibacter sp. DP1N21-5 TaxID=2836867 RepID=UPI001C46F658|nr:GNAT family N-acetyltransferase [Maritimibacter sp. DP1N21-5]MBV7410680.1 GNAT family N-acetyltransferase [Maritimibacter sp. DP1N21-5]
MRPPQADEGPTCRDGFPVHQCTAWDHLGPQSPRQTNLAFTLDGPVRARGMIRITRVLPGLSVAAIQRGPVTPSPADLAHVLPPIEAALAARGVATLTVNPVWTGDDVPAAREALVAQGYAQVPAALQNFPTATAGLDLTRSADEIRAGMSKSGRKDLRKATDNGIAARPMASLSEAEAANEAMRAMAAATGMQTDAQHDFRRHFDYLSRHTDDGVILVTTLDGEVFGGLVSYCEGDVGYGFNLCTRPDITLPRTHVMMFEAALALKAKGCRRFDLVGYDSGGDAQRLGRSMFKKHFGPDIIDVLPIFSKPLRPFAHHAVQGLRATLRRARGLRHRTGKGGQDA